LHRETAGDGDSLPLATREFVRVFVDELLGRLERHSPKQRENRLLGVGPLAAMAQGKAPYNAEVVKRNAGFLDNLSRMPWDGFDPSTKDVKSRAKPELYSNMNEVKQAASHLENETHKLYQVSQSGDEAAVKAQIAAVGKACGGCHDKFREKQ